MPGTDMSLQVVGAGLGRTGTASLKMALEELLGGRCHHMFEVLERPEEISVWTAAARGDMPDWQRLLSDYVALVDWPGASFWPELVEAFPDALVLLSVRDLDEWYDSAAATIFPESSDPLRTDEQKARRLMWLEILRHRFVEDLADRDLVIGGACSQRGGHCFGADRSAAHMEPGRRLGPDLWRPRATGARPAVPSDQHPRGVHRAPGRSSRP